MDTLDSLNYLSLDNMDDSRIDEYKRNIEKISKTSESARAYLDKVLDYRDLTKMEMSTLLRMSRKKEIQSIVKTPLKGGDCRMKKNINV